MLSISRIESLSHGLNYYKKDNYYINDGPQEQEYSQWFGKAAKEFGLKNEVNFKDFNRALLGVSEDGVLGKQKITELNLYLSIAQINNFRQKSYSYLQASNLNKDEKKVIYKSLFRLSARREKIPKTSIAEYQKKISSILDKSKNPHPDIASIKKYFQKELKMFESKTARRIAYDLTFSAPKSVSLAALVGDDKELIHAHRCAVEEALKTLETHYSQIRIRNKHLSKRQIEVTGNVAVATFEHDVSRKVDPQLHTHCVLMTFTKRFDGTWRSIYQDGFFYDSKKLGVVYQNALARQVVSLGYEIQTYSNGTFDIKGYTKEQINAFSKRTAQLYEMGAHTQKEKTQIIHKNRTKKGNIAKKSLREKWKLEAEHLGIVHPVRMMRKNIVDKKTDHFNNTFSMNFGKGLETTKGIGALMHYFSSQRHLENDESHKKYISR